MDTVDQSDPKPTPAPRQINGIAFAGAVALSIIAGLFIAFMFGLLSDAIEQTGYGMMIPMITAAIGVPIFLVLGVPAAWFVMRKRHIAAWQGAALGFVVNAAAAAVAYVLSAATYGGTDDSIPAIFGAGAIAAPIWGALLTGFYNVFSLSSKTR